MADENKKKITLIVDKELYKSVKIFAAQTNSTISKVVEAGLKNVINKEVS